jgi:hypothetical protein
LQTHTQVAATPTTSGAIVSPAARGTTTDDTLTTAYDPYAGQPANSTRVVQAVYLVFGAIVSLLLIRFLPRALAANADTGFAQAMYAVTGVVVGAFIGLFGTSQIATGAALGTLDTGRVDRLCRHKLATGQGSVADIRRQPLWQRRQQTNAGWVA